MRLGRALIAMAGALMAAAVPALPQSLAVPKRVEAGSAVSIQTTGTGKATLYIVGPGQAIKREAQLGGTIYIPSALLYNAGRYLAVLAWEGGSANEQFDVAPRKNAGTLSFLARPSRLPVSLHQGINGAVYVSDVYRNLIPDPMTVTFELTDPSGAVQKQTATTREGAAWIGLDSTARQGTDNFVARVGDVIGTRVIRQVPGDPCGLKMSAQRSGQQVDLATDPVRDCSGNAVPDGTIVTFTESRNGMQSTVDVPLKRGVAKVEMPAADGATISVASGVVMGNQIRWEK